MLDDYDKAKQMLEEFKAIGGGTIGEASTKHWGRNTAGMAKLSEETGVHIICCTGYLCESQCDMDAWIGAVSYTHLINTKMVTLKCHMICGITAGLAGIVAASKVNNGHPATGDGYEMFAIAATVLGGTSLAGGSGSVARAMFGCAIIAVINNGMTLMEISAYWQKVVIGAIIILAVMLDMAQKLSLIHI